MISVRREVYQEVIERDNYCCRLCGSGYFLELHHIIYRSEDKNLINEPINCIMLCRHHHRLVHSNKKKYQPILKKINEKYKK